LIDKRHPTYSVGPEQSRICQYISTVVASYEGRGFKQQVYFGHKKETILVPQAKKGVVVAKEYGRWTPLHVAAVEGRTKEVEKLLRENEDLNENSNPNLTDDIGFKPLDWASPRLGKRAYELLKSRTDEPLEEDHNPYRGR
jgi:hypothetical protein